MSKKISIITVVLNAEKTIERTIKSVVSQKYNNIEYIIIDGGSTDSTLDIIKKYEEQIEYFVSEPDYGIYDAMNKGIRYATGEIVGIINSDDWYEKDIFIDVAKCFEKYNLDGLFGDLKYHRADGNVDKLQNDSFKFFWRGMVMGHPTVFVRRDVYLKYGLYDCKYRIAADFDLLCKIIYSGVRFAYIKKNIANFSEGGISTTQSQICVKETLDIAMRRIDKELWLICLKKLIQDDRTFIFGAGIWGEFMVSIMEGIFEISGVVDNDSRKWGRYFGAFLISSSDVLISSEDKILIATEAYDNIIANQLCEMGISSERIITLGSCMELYTERLELKINKCIEILS